MRYLFGDSSPFPLGENFLALLCAATDACVAILSADEQVDDVKRLIREADQRAARELLDLKDLAATLEQTFGPEGSHVAKPQTHAESAFCKTAAFAWSSLKSSREEVQRDRDAAAVQANLLCPHAQILPALQTMLIAHQLPNTSWGIKWNAGFGGAGSTAELYASTTFGLAATFDVAIPVGHLFARPVPVTMLRKGSTIRLLKKPLLRKPRPTPIILDGLFLTAVMLTPQKATMSLRSSASRSSEGVDVVFHDDGGATVMVTRVDAKGYPLANEEQLRPEDATVAQGIWRRIVTTIGPLLEHRRRITAATFGGVSVTEVARPAAIAQGIIAAIAPLVGEIARRTATPGELALKRVVADGCREELFISYDTVLDRTSGLSPQNEALFEAYGLREPKTQPQLGVVHRLPVVRPPRLRAKTA